MHNQVLFYKNLFYSLTFIFSIAFFTNNAQSVATIRGTIDNTSLTTIQIATDRLYLGKGIEIDTIQLTNGKFEYTTQLSQPRLVEFVAGEMSQTIFVEPGNSLELEIKNKTILFSGAGAEQNTFLKSFYTTFQNDFVDTLMQQKMLSTGVDAFEMALFESTKKQNAYLKNFADKDKFTSAFTAYMQNTINYHYWAALLAYPIINANISAKILTVNALPQIMFDGFDKVKVNNDDAINTESYRQFLKYYVIYFTSKNNGFNKFTDFSISADRKLMFAKEKLTGTAFNYWLAQFLVDECGRLSPYYTKKLFNDLSEADKQNVYTKAVNNVCGERMAMKEEKKKEEKQVASTRKKDDFSFTDVNGKKVTLSDFNGKVVYIDFWASWCGPCRKNMPFSKQLHAQLTDKQKKKIVFLYISIDEDLAAWKKGINDLGIEGVNVISPGNWKSPACEYFQISGIPRYMIMDKKGEIVDFNAARPSDNAVLTKLLKLAEE